MGVSFYALLDMATVDYTATESIATDEADLDSSVA